jgi:hypothetical protein
MTPHVVVRQSSDPCDAGTVMVTRNVPPAPKGVARPTPYGGGSDETQADEPEAPDRSAPPTHADPETGAAEVQTAT